MKFLVLFTLAFIGYCAAFGAYDEGVVPLNCTNPNEKYDCGSACQNECNTLGETCPIVNIVCNRLCYCIEGYARDCDCKCIPENECPEKGTCERSCRF